MTMMSELLYELERGFQNYDPWILETTFTTQNGGQCANHSAIINPSKQIDANRGLNNATALHRGNNLP